MQVQFDVDKQKATHYIIYVVAFLFVAGLLVTGGCSVYNKYFHKEQVAQVSQEELKDVGVLTEKLDVTPQEAKEIAKQIAKKEASGDPDMVYYVKGDTVQEAATQVAQDIQNNKSPANTIPADKTTVTPVTNPKTGEQKVEVNRITLDKARIGTSALVLAGGNESPEIGAGLTYHNKDNELTAGYTTKQRVFVMGTHYF